jgi:hypothetical protein
MGRGRNGAGRQGRTTTGIRRQREGSRTSYTFTVNGQRGELRVFADNPGYRVRDTLFLVNGSYDRANTMDAATGRSLVLQALKAWRREVKDAPEGTMWGGYANGDDGLGDRRVKFYRNLGFSPPTREDVQLGIKRNGKVVPFSYL